MGFLDFFKKVQVNNKTKTYWKELGGYYAYFSSFGNDIYQSELVRSCIRPLANFTSKAYCVSSNDYIARILNERPNMYMNGRSFLKKIRTKYEVDNTVFVYIQRNEFNRATGFYPVPYISYEAIDYSGNLYITFDFANGTKMTCAWDDLVVLRKDYNKSDIAGDDNTALLPLLDLIKTSNKGMENAIKSTANLRGILKSKIAMLDREDIKKQQENFVADYLNLENNGGIASLDSSQEFQPISMSPIVSNAAQMKELREDLYRYFGVNEKVVTGDMSGEEIEAFYELSIEPFLVDLSDELQSKIFTSRELGYGNHLMYEANKIQFASLTKKIDLWSNVVLYGGMTINEWRLACNMPPIEGGDVPIQRLDAAPIDAIKTEQTEESEDGTDEPQG